MSTIGTTILPYNHRTSDNYESGIQIASIQGDKCPVHSGYTLSKSH